MVGRKLQLVIWSIGLLFLSTWSSADDDSVIAKIQVPVGCVPDKSVIGMIDNLKPPVKDNRVNELEELDRLIDDWAKLYEPMNSLPAVGAQQPSKKDLRKKRIEAQRAISKRVRDLSKKYGLRAGFWNHYVLSRTTIEGLATTGEDESDVIVRPLTTSSNSDSTEMGDEAMEATSDDQKLTINDKENTSLSLKYSAKLSDIFDRGASSEKAVKDYLSIYKKEYDEKMAAFNTSKKSVNESFLEAKSALDVACIKTKNCDVSNLRNAAELHSNVDELISIRNNLYSFFNGKTFKPAASGGQSQYAGCAAKWYSAKMERI